MLQGYLVGWIELLVNSNASCSINNPFYCSFWFRFWADFNCWTATIFESDQHGWYCDFFCNWSFFFNYWIDFLFFSYFKSEYWPPAIPVWPAQFDNKLIISFFCFVIKFSSSFANKYSVLVVATSLEGILFIIAQETVKKAINR